MPRLRRQSGWKRSQRSQPALSSCSPPPSFSFWTQRSPAHAETGRQGANRLPMMETHFPPEERLDILKAADSQRKWYSLDDERVCAICNRVFTDGRSIFNATTRGIIFFPVLPPAAGQISIIGSFAKFLRRFIKRTSIKPKPNSLSRSPEESCSENRLVLHRPDWQWREMPKARLAKRS